MATIEKLADLTNRKVSEISNAFAVQDLQRCFHTPPSGGGSKYSPPHLGALENKTGKYCSS